MEKSGECSKNNESSDKIMIYPFINDLVDSLFNEEFNNLVNKNTESNTDKSVFMMFVNIYFMAYLHVQEKQNLIQDINIDSHTNKKLLLKKMLSEVVKCPEKRQMCVALIKQINPLFNIDSVIKPGEHKFIE